MASVCVYPTVKSVLTEAPETLPRSRENANTGLVVHVSTRDTAKERKAYHSSLIAR